MEGSDSVFWCCALCSTAAAVSIWAWKGTRAGLWAFAVWALGCLLYFGGSPGWCGALALSCGLFLFCVTLGRREEMIPMHGKAVLITGCDTGFGHALAQRLSSRGVLVFAGVLDADGPGAQRLRTWQGCEERLRVLQLDVTERSQVEQARASILAQVGEAGLWGLVNNAGILGCLADAEIQPLRAFRRCLDVNFLSAVEMCQVFLPLLRRSRGRIVNVTSMGGVVPYPFFSAYGASKAALIVFSGAMRMELARWGVKVAMIQPTGFRTNIFKYAEERNGLWETFESLSSEAREVYGKEYVLSSASHATNMARRLSEDLRPVLDDMCHALMSAAPKALYCSGRTAWLFPFLYNLCPEVVSDAVIGRLFGQRSNKG